MKGKRLRGGIDLLDPMKVAEYWDRHEHGTVYRGWECFCREVDPYITHVKAPRDIDVDLVDSMFFEWFVFDYRMSDGRTPLEIYAECAPDGLDACKQSLMCQLRQTQRFAQYWVISQDPLAGVSTLRDASNGEVLMLHDDIVAQTPWWQHGLLGLRVALLDGTWYMMGRTPMHDAGRPLSVTGYIERPTFLSLVQKTVGLDGEYLDSVQLHEYVAVDAA
ncbi:MAG: hypothetical protein UHI81_06255 [Olegusella sp.]|nr:hypothetical protein [Olegusella sp.]